MSNFNTLVSTINKLHEQLQQAAVNAVNQMLTIRNWLIGYYIVEFEQNGKDKAEYGNRLIESIAAELNHIKGIDKRSLFRFRQFYLYYPQIAETIRGAVFPLLEQTAKMGTLSPQLRLPDLKKVGTLSPQFKPNLSVAGKKILSRLSYSHIEKELNKL